MPLISHLSNIMPVLQEDIEVMKSNLNNWKTYIETEEDKQVYIKKVNSNSTYSVK